MTCESTSRLRGVRCPWHGEYERCVVARGTEPHLFARYYCEARSSTGGEG